MACNNLHFKVDGSRIILLTSKNRINAPLNLQCRLYRLPKSNFTSQKISYSLLKYYKTKIILNMATYNIYIAVGNVRKQLLKVKKQSQKF